MARDADYDVFLQECPCPIYVPWVLVSLRMRGKYLAITHHADQMRVCGLRTRLRPFKHRENLKLKHRAETGTP